MTQHMAKAEPARFYLFQATSLRAFTPEKSRKIHMPPPSHLKYDDLERTTRATHIVRAAPQ